MQPDFPWYWENIFASALSKHDPPARQIRALVITSELLVATEISPVATKKSSGNSSNGSSNSSGGVTTTTTTTTTATHQATSNDMVEEKTGKIVESH